MTTSPPAARALDIAPVALVALGCAFGYAVQAATLAAFPRRRRAPAAPQPALRPMEPVSLFALLRLGVPVGIMFGLEAGLFTVVGFGAGHLGSVQLAAHQVVSQLCYVTFLVPSAIGYATSVVVGRAAATRDSRNVLRAGGAGLGLGVLCMIAASLLFVAAPEAVISLLLDAKREPEVAQTSVALLRVAAVFQIVDGIQGVAGGALRGLGDTKAPMVIGILSYWGVGLSVAFVLAFVARLGVVGLWWGLAAGLGTAAIALTARLLRHARRENRATE